MESNGEEIKGRGTKKGRRAGSRKKGREVTSRRRGEVRGKKGG